MQLVRARNRFKLLQDEQRVAQLAKIRVNEADIRDTDIACADVVFINATCFSYALWLEVVKNLSSLNPLTYIIVTSKQLPLTQFQLIQEGLKPMSWGFVTVRIYQKLENYDIHHEKFSN